MVKAVRPMGNKSRLKIDWSVTNAVKERPKKGKTKKNIQLIFCHKKIDFVPLINFNHNESDRGRGKCNNNCRWYFDESKT